MHAPFVSNDFADVAHISGFQFGVSDANGARLALFRNEALCIDGHIPAVLGAFRPGTHEQAFGALLDAVLDRARQLGYRYAVGPMDGSTWRTYRLPTEGGIELPFFLEPYAPLAVSTWWQRRGFVPLQTYHSALATDLGYDAGTLERLTRQFTAMGLRLRFLRRDDCDGELARLYHFNVAAFTDSFLFSPISQPDFAALYRPVWERLDPELVLLAETGDGQLAGLFFMLHDHLDPTGRTAIVKTLARLPDERLLGLGEWLCLRGLQVLEARGYTRLIHALMRDDNASTRRSRQFAGTVMRRYALFGRSL